jgi:fatty-acyl-CoA synthase
MTISVASALEHWARVVPDQVAVDFEDDEITYRELNRWADGIAHLLRERGVRPGDRVAIAGGSSTEWVALDLGIHRADAIVAPFNIRMTARELQVLAEESEPAIIAHDDALRERIATVQAAHGTFSMLDFKEITALRDRAHPAFPTVEVAADDPSVIVFTSGTTGRPKGVIYTHTTLASMMYELSLIHDMPRNGHRPFLALPLYTAIGVIYSLERTMLHGGTLVMESRFDPERALKIISEKKITFIGAPSIVYDRIAAVEGFADADLSSLRNTDVGGSRVERATIEKWKHHGIQICQMYGQTEIGGYATVNSKAMAIEHPEYCGTGGVFTRFRVVAPDGQDLPAGLVGEILLRGPGMTPGYWGQPEATAATIVDGWIHTGDLGRVEPDGNLVFVDRMKDMIVTGGLNVAPAEIEEVIEQMPGVLEVAVIPVPDPKFQETPAALVRATGDVTPADVVAHCSGRLADYKVPRYVVMVDSDLPRTATGKLEKAVLRKDYADVPNVHPKLR